MFKVAQIKKVDWPVDVKVPQDGGAVRKQRFTAKLEILSNEEFERELMNGDVLERTLVGIGADCCDEDGQPLEFNEETKAALLRIPYVRVALMEAVQQAHAGRAAAKN